MKNIKKFKLSLIKFFVEDQKRLKVISKEDTSNITIIFQNIEIEIVLGLNKMRIDVSGIFVF